MAEVLVDALTGDEVIVVPGRALRPDTFRVDAAPVDPRVSTCPFCDGNEHETPPEIARTGPGAPNTPGWHTRVVPNKYPIVPQCHEVIILSPAHDRDLAALDGQAATEALRVMRDRAAAHLTSGAAYVQVFVNHGRAAGASIEHPHAQLVALPRVPPRVETRLARFSDERFGAGRVLVTDNGDAAVWCPSAATTPFAMRAALTDPGAQFAEASDDEIAAFADALTDALRRMQHVLGAPAYNVVIETAPRESSAPFRWWVDIVPRISVAAGFELGTGVWVNVVPAADAAAALRDGQ
ncbi:MAG TPA: hypothetical protein VFR41_14640 [Acidimicrobiia bacterium]|nr:hypothetical protein [Acidimicrobiia bacterium]